MKSTQVTGVRHVGLVVSEIQQSRKFYESIGFVAEGNPTEESGLLAEALVGVPGCVYLTVKMHLKSDEQTLWRESGFRLELVQYLHPLVSHERNFDNTVIGKVHLCFTVQDIEQSLEMINRNGGFSPFSITTDKTGHRKYIYVFDPDGNPLELAQHV